MFVKKSHKKTYLLVFLVGVLVLYAWFEGSLFGNFDENKSQLRLNSAQADVKIGGAFSLVDQTGNTVTEKDFSHLYKLVFFGYTWCPDICPTELLIISQALEILDNDNEKIVALFITIDPARDTPEKLASYLNNFHPNIVGLTGSEKDISEAAKAYRVYYKRTEETLNSEAADSENYIMDHSAYIYLISPNDKYIRHFVRGQEPKEIAIAVKKNL